MSKILVIQMDDPAGFAPEKDSTLALAREAQQRGYEIYYYLPTQLAGTAEGIFATVTRFIPLEKDDPFYELGETKHMNLEKADVILIRQDPPYNMEYLGCLWLLEQLKKPKIFNRPEAIRNRPEKIFPLEFKGYIPATCISADKTQLDAFRKAQGDVVLKPLYGFGGDSIFLIKAGEAGFAAKVAQLQEGQKLPVILQAFLPDVYEQEKRIMLINGQALGAFNRRPAGDGFVSNGALGGSAHETELSDKQREIARVVGEVCAREGLLFVGLDVIGDYLIEINTTCPTGIPVTKRLYGIDLAKSFWDSAEAC